MSFTYKHTRIACYLGYITQAIVNNLAPLLFLTFQRQFDISLDKIAALIGINFGVQIAVDLAATKFVDKIGYRTSALLAQVFATLGLVSMGILPFVLPSPYVGLLIAIVLNAIGGGLLEVIVSPIIEALPSDRKAAEMSFLHSFYSWGHVGVVLLSTLYFVTIGTGSWQFLPICWALVPLFNLFLFSKVPLAPLVEAHEEPIPLRKLFGRKLFLLFFLLMICSGAAEQSMAQWSSFFAEAGLGISKTMGDLLGTCSFAVCMGISRLFYGIKGEKIRLENGLLASSVLCIFSYLLAIFSPVPALSLLGCALCGLSVGMLWPGVFSLTSKYFRRGGTAMFAILALAGDVGCAGGPGLVGVLSDAVEQGSITFTANWFPSGSLTETAMKTGLLASTCFAVILLVGFLVLVVRRNKLKTTD
ncbi:MAG: MFS transporter [Oscillospiraceae bacterium]